MNASVRVVRAARQPGSAPGRRTLLGLLIPPRPAAAVQVVRVQDSSAAISDALGGDLLDDATTWWTPGGAVLSAYLAEDRTAAADNPCLSLIATRLGLTDRSFHARARGQALILGTSPTGDDVDLPAMVLAEAVRCSVPVELLGPGHAR